MAECCGAERPESELEKVERIIIAGLQKARCTESDLKSRRKGHPAKVRLAQQLRSQTTLTVAWIAARLQWARALMPCNYCSVPPIRPGCSDTGHRPLITALGGSFSESVSNKYYTNTACARRPPELVVFDMIDATLQNTVLLPAPSLISPPVAGNIQPNAVSADGTPALNVESLKLDVERSSSPPPTADLCPPTSPSAVPLAPAPGESARAFAAFCAYLELGPARRYAAVARQSGVSLRTVKSWSSQFDWRDRLNRHTTLAAEKFIQTTQVEQLETADREQSFRERQFLLAEVILDVTERYFERLDEMDFEHVRLPDVCRALEFASRLAGHARQSEAAAPDHGLRDHLAALLDQAFRETPKPASP